MVEPAELLEKMKNPPQKVSLSLNGTITDADLGETILSVLVRLGHRKIRLSQKYKEWRGFYCGTGTCFECLVTVDGVPNIRACITPVSDAMHITLDDVPEK
jgi:D-hydroxyproline dehydrogenase subunit gamma